MIIPRISLLVFFLTNFAPSNDNSQGTVPTRDAISIELRTDIDSLKGVIEDLMFQQTNNEKFLNLLEKTNSQISLWSNPYGFFVAALGLLFTVLTIIATFIIFRQGAEYRAMLSNSISNYQNIINTFLEEKKMELEERITETEGKLASAGDKQRKEFEGVIEELKRKKDYVDSQLSFQPVHIAGGYGTTATPFFTAGAPPSIGGVFTKQEKKTKCPHCGFEFEASRTISGIRIGASAKWIERCPNCHQGFVV